MDQGHVPTGADPTTPDGEPADDSVVRAPVARVLRVLANTMPDPTVTSMEGVPVELDAQVAALRPSWWNRIWVRALSAAIIPEATGGKVEL
jgi:hypothetical protein